MTRYDAEIVRSRALVIDPNPTSRTILAGQLRELGVGTVIQTGRLTDARRHLELQAFDIVLCEQVFHGAGSTGQELLDDLRRAQMMSYATVFVMVTAEASYAAVAEAAESALDSYLLKPHSAQALVERLQQARHRKRVLKHIFSAIEAGDFARAARLCERKFDDRSDYWLYAARIGAELHLRLGQHAEARRLYDAVIAARTLPWARLGVARAQIDAGDAPAARRTLENLIADQPGFTDAYDVMGRTQVEQGQLGPALETYRKATEMTPGSITRLQRQGMLAFYLGERDEARSALEKAKRMGLNSKLFDLQTLVLLAIVRFIDRDGKGLQRCLDSLQRAQEKAEGSQRIRRLFAVAEAFHLMLHRLPAQAIAKVCSLAGQIRETGFDFEAACNLVAMLAHLRSAALPLEAPEVWIEAVALRFCSTRSLTELLARAAQVHPPYAELIRAQNGRINGMIELAMGHSLNGAPTASVHALLAQAEQTLNGKFIDMARAVLIRHADKVADGPALLSRADALRRQLGNPTIAPLDGENQRQAGGMVLRTTPAATPKAKAATAANSAAKAPAAPGAPSEQTALP